MRQVAVGADGTAEALHLVEAPVPALRPDGLLIDVAFAGVNRPDILQRKGLYPPPADASPVLGLEVSGTVRAVGALVHDWQVGEAVCALVPGGGYAEVCATPAAQALRPPAGVSLEQAAGLPENWFTVWANLTEQGNLASGERLLVHGGTSGIGLAAIQLAVLRGASCYVTVGDEDKARLACGFGAVAAINYRTGDFVARVRELTGSDAGVDVILDMVGGDYIARNVSLLRRDGRLVLIAFQRGARVELDFSVVLRQRLVITGSGMRPRSVAEKGVIRDGLLREVWPALASGRVRTHVHAVLPLAEAGAAHRLMESGVHSGKIILRVGGY